MFEPTQEELKERLRRAESEEEKEALMQEYSQKMAKAQDDIEQQKQRKLRDVRKLLKEERLKRKKELFKYVFQQRTASLPLLFLSTEKHLKAVAQHIKQYNMKTLLNSFVLNGHKLRFHSQS